MRDGLVNACLLQREWPVARVLRKRLSNCGRAWGSLQGQSRAIDRPVSGTWKARCQFRRARFAARDVVLEVALKLVLLPSLSADAMLRMDGSARFELRSLHVPPTAAPLSAAPAPLADDACESLRPLKDRCSQTRPSARRSASFAASTPSRSCHRRPRYVVSRLSSSCKSRALAARHAFHIFSTLGSVGARRRPVGRSPGATRACTRAASRRHEAVVAELARRLCSAQKARRIARVISSSKSLLDVPT